jgi:hypothetical protein
VTAVDTTFATVISPERAVADARLGLVAYAGGVVGIVGLAALGLMFAIEVPTGGPFRFGTANDIGGSIFAALFIPVVVGLERHLPRTAWSRALAGVTVAASVAGIVLPLLLVSGRLSFEAETPLVVAAFELQSLWLLLAGRRMRGVPGLAGRLARMTEVVGASFIVGTAVAGASLALPAGSPAQLVVGGIGVAIGVVGWVGWPVWFLAVGRALRRRDG